MRRGRGQSGFTLVETLLVVLISSVLVVPVLLWFSLALRERPVVEEGLVRMSGTGFLSRYLPEDIAVAGAAAVDEAGADAVNLNWEDCRHGPGDGGRRVLVMVRHGPVPSKIVYAEAPLEQGGTEHPVRRSIWRRECVAATGLGTEAIQVLEDVEPGSTSASCSTESADAPCEQVELVTTPVATGEELAMVGLRRVDTASVEHLRTGNRVPVAKIDVVSQTVRQPYEVTFSAARSHDPDGQLLCYQWVFPTSAEGADPPGTPDVVTVEVPWTPQGDGEAAPSSPGCPAGSSPDAGADPELQVRRFPTSGVYYVELTVTDDEGVASTTYKRIEIIPPDPIAAARVRSVSDGDVAGRAIFEFAARWISEETGEVIGSEHPDGVIAQYEWVVSFDGGGPDSKFVALRGSPDPWYLALPESMAGSVTVVLTVTDERGKSDSTAEGLVLSAPDPPTAPPPPEPPPGAHPPPAGLASGGASGAGTAQLVWAPAGAVDRYRVELDHSGPGCARRSVHLVAPSPTPRQVLYPSLCGFGSTARARVGTELGGTIAWSGWIDVDLPAFWVPPDDPTPPEPTPTDPAVEGP